MDSFSRVYSIDNWSSELLEGERNTLGCVGYVEENKDD